MYWIFKEFYYFLKRFTKHKFLLFLVFIAICFILFFQPKKAYATSLDSNYFTNTDVSIARSIVGDSVWNNSNYDIFLGEYPSSASYGKFVLYFDYNDIISFVHNQYGSNYNPSYYDFSSRYYPLSSWVFSCVSFNSNSVKKSILIQSSRPSSYACKTLYSRDTNNNPYNLQSPDVSYTTPIKFLPIRSHLAIKNENTTLYQPSSFSPFISNSASISNLSFDYLSINCRGLVSSNYDMWLHVNYNDNNYTIYITDDMITNIGDNTYISIPKNEILNNIVVANGNNIEFGLQVRIPATSNYYYNLGTYTLSLSSDEVEQINNDSNRDLLTDISNNQQETTNAINNLNNTIISTSEETVNAINDTTTAVNDLNNTITDDDVDFDEIDLPSDSSEDITQDGVNGIFTSIYNAFCTGEAQDIVFPIPFTNKNITLQASYVYDMLNNSGASWVINIIQAFWWYLISRYIIKDIVNKINKIKSGNVEAIEETNIKGDML